MADDDLHLFPPEVAVNRRIIRNRKADFLRRAVQQRFYLPVRRLFTQKCEKCLDISKINRIDAAARAVFEYHAQHVFIFSNDRRA